ncbi:hypothetical protein C8J55DRAFT_604503 [Lentinula edodes]|uniref:Uncharacterized protein n=1 Tax=Lentinula lateritia TaxID=40482 RepID=A0A9W9AMI9_9AGAR|nr:hypothetical protein C8J55DRAFT_604503 [Lentinula edodes]
MRLVSYVSFGLGLFSFTYAAPLLADSSNAGVLFFKDHSASRFQARSSPQSSNRLPPLPPPPVTEEYSLPMVIPPPPADLAIYDTLDPLLITFPGDNGTFVPDFEHRVQDWIVRIFFLKGRITAKSTVALPTPAASATQPAKLNSEVISPASTSTLIMELTSN